MESVRFLGVTVHRLTTDELTRCVVQAVEDGRKIVVGNHNLHSVYLYHHNPRFRAFPLSSKTLTTWATVESFWPIATYMQ